MTNPQNSGTFLYTCSGVDLSHLPPCKDAMDMHLMRRTIKPWFGI
jgi:hypothetical protein